MYKDLMSLMMAAEESMIRSELGIGGVDDCDVYEEISAMESAVYGGSVNGGMALESLFTEEETDSYGWGAALESDDSASEKKPNIFKKIGEWIKGAFKKIGEVFKSIGEKIKEWWRSHFNKQVKTARSQTAPSPATINYKNARDPSNPDTPTASAEKVKSTGRRYMDLIISTIDGGIKPANMAMSLVEGMKAQIGKAFNQEKFNSDYEKLESMLSDVESQISEIKDAKVEFENAIQPFKSAGEDYRQYLPSNNLNVLQNNAEKIEQRCSAHAKFCEGFVAEYDRITANYKIDPAHRGGYSESREIDGTNVTIHGASTGFEQALYKTSKIYLATATLMNKATDEYLSSVEKLRH